MVGMFVLVLEIAGSRVLAPAFGSTIYVWTAQICVVLVALSLGYLYGGRIAQDETGRERISRMSIYISLSLGAAILLSDVALAFCAELGPVIGPFAFSTFLFFLPCFFAGALTPIILEIYLKDMRHAGNDAGRIYAISTFGSLIGGLASSYAIIPFIGVKTGMLAFAFLFCVIGIALRGRPQVSAAAAFLLIMSIAAMPAHQTAVMIPRSFTSIESVDSQYYHIRVAENGTHRILMLDDKLHSMQIIGDRSLSLEYAKTMAAIASAHLGGGTGKIGIMGLGGGSLAGYFVRKGVEVDAFEIDPQVRNVAVQRFGMGESPGLNVEIGDGRALLSRKNGEYDALLVDAYSSTFIPPHLASREAFAQYRNSLKDDGVIVINLVSSMRDEKSYFLRSVSATMREAFPYQIALYRKGDGDLENVILVGSKIPFESAFLNEAASLASVAIDWEMGDINTDERTTLDYAAAVVGG